MDLIRKMACPCALNLVFVRKNQGKTQFSDKNKDSLTRWQPLTITQSGGDCPAVKPPQLLGFFIPREFQRPRLTHRTVGSV